MSNITTKDQERIQNYIDQNLIRFDGVITDPNQIRRAAKKLGLRALVTEAYEQIHAYVDENPDEIHVVTSKSVGNGRGFLVGMLYAGLFVDFALTFEVDATISHRDAVAAMESLAEDVARQIYEKKFEGQEPVCECWGGGGCGGRERDK